MHCASLFSFFCVFWFLLFCLLSSSAAAVVPAALASFVMVVGVVELGIASPRGWHPACRDIRAILDETQELVFSHRLAELAQHVIVYVACFAASIKESTGVVVSADDVFPRKQIGAHRQEDREGVRIWVHFRLVCEPVKDAKSDL